MVEETDTTKEKTWLTENRTRIVIKNLNKKHINAFYVPTRVEALSTILEMSLMTSQW